MKIRNPLRQSGKAMNARLRTWLRPDDRVPPFKVFCVGLSRTGTKSLNTALRTLGYHSDHFSTQLMELKSGELTLDLAAVRDYDALTDVTAARFYRELDKHYDNAKFILTVRDPEKWLRSCEQHFLPVRPGRWPYGVGKVIQLRRDLYGADSFDRDRFLAAYQTHIGMVREYFDERPEDLLELDITAGKGWHELCEFLHLPEPDKPFPWANRAATPRQ